MLHRIDACYNHYDKIPDVELVSLNTLTEEDCYERTERNSVTGKPFSYPKYMSMPMSSSRSPR